MASHHRTSEVGSGASRRRVRSRMVCEGLEGRQLLSTATATPPVGFVPPPPPVLLGTADAVPGRGMPGPFGGGFGRGAGMDFGGGRHGHSAPGVAPGDPGAISADLKTALDKLTTDSAAVQAKSQVTLGQLATLNSDVRAAGKAATQAVSDASVKTLRQDARLTDASLPDLTKVEADYAAVLASAGIPQDKIDKVIADVDAIRTASGATADDWKTLADDRNAVATALKAAKPTNTDSTTTDTTATVGTAAVKTAGTQPTSSGQVHKMRPFGRGHFGHGFGAGRSLQGTGMARFRSRGRS